MLKEILYSSALDIEGNIIHIKNAIKGRQYYCPTCKEEFILRKSGKTGKRSKRPHFAHNNITSNCTPEGVLHASFKRLLFELLNKYKQENKILNVVWQCNECFADYSKVQFNRNLLTNVVMIKEEYHLKSCRPDIALLDKEENVIGVIEIVVTHEPEENTINYYKENGITLIQINLTSEDDLLIIEEKIAYPSIVNYCINPICKNIENHQGKRNLYVGDIGCKSCGQKVKTFALEEGCVFGKRRTKLLTEKELKVLEVNGGLFTLKHDIQTGIKYPIIRCRNCELRNKIRRARYIKR